MSIPSEAPTAKARIHRMNHDSSKDTLWAQFWISQDFLWISRELFGDLDGPAIRTKPIASGSGAHPSHEPRQLKTQLVGAFFDFLGFSLGFRCRWSSARSAGPRSGSVQIWAKSSTDRPHKIWSPPNKIWASFRGSCPATCHIPLDDTALIAVHLCFTTAFPARDYSRLHNSVKTTHFFILFGRLCPR